MNKQELKNKLSSYWVLFFLTIGIGLILRLWGIWHSYPYSFYGDEIHFVKRSLSFGSGDLNPHWFHKPALYMYILFFEYGLYFVFGKIIGLWSSTDQFAISYISNPGPFYLIGRVTTAMFSMGTVVVTGMIVKNLMNRRTSIFAMLLLSLSFGLTFTSKHVKADTPCMFFTVYSLLFLVQFLKERDTKYLLLSALLAGVGTATKYYSIILILPIILCIVITMQRSLSIIQNFTRLVFLSISVMLICHLVFFMLSPYNFIDPLGREATFKKHYQLSRKIFNYPKMNETEKKIEAEKNQHHSRYTKKINFGKITEGIVDYISVMRKGAGSWVMLFALFGVILIAKNRLSFQIFILYLFAIIYVSISIFLYPGYAQIRHQVIIYPIVVIPAAYFVNWVLEKYKKNYIGLSVIIVLLIFTVKPIIDMNAQFSMPDSRNVAKEWIESNIEPYSKILLDENGPMLWQSEKELMSVLNESKKADQKGQFTAHYDTYIEYTIKASQEFIKYNIFEIRLPWWREKEVKKGAHRLTATRDKDMGNPLKLVGLDSYSDYKERGYEYAIVSSQSYKAFFIDNEMSDNFPSFRDFYHELFNKGILIKKFSKENGYFGPEIRIFQL